jgi:hypothetical protein
VTGVLLKLTGAWTKASQVVQTMADRFQRAAEKATLQEAHRLRAAIVENITSGGASSGAPFQPLSPLTLIMRRFRRNFAGTKPLIQTASLRNAVNVVKVGNGMVFVGIPRKAKSKTGGSLVNVAEVHEFGSKTYSITMTPKMQRFLMKAFRSAGVVGSGGKGSGSGGVITIRIPARPFVGPAVDKHAKPEDVKARFWAVVSKEMGGDLGS